MLFEDAFDDDDFSATNERFLAKARQAGPPGADISGWQHTVWHSLELPAPLVLATESLHRYQSDTSRGLAPFKERILPSLRAWDEFQYNYDEVTLCSSVTIASLLTLAVLKRNGIKTILFETPTYYATVEQAMALELRPILVPCYLGESFDFRRGMGILDQRVGELAVWLCQPRPALGWDQDLATVAAVLDRLSPGSFLVLDEATEQHWPAQLAKLTPADPRVIRLRSLVKGIGLNGLRVAYIGHTSRLRRQLLELVEIFQGGLDYETLQITCALLEDESGFRSLLRAAHDQVSHLYRVLKTALLGTDIALSRIANGYIGSLALPRPTHLTRAAFGALLLDYCERLNCPVMLGASMYFARDNDREFVRINYYNDPARVLTGVEALSRFLRPDDVQQH